MFQRKRVKKGTSQLSKERPNCLIMTMNIFIVKAAVESAAFVVWNASQCQIA